MAIRDEEIGRSEIAGDEVSGREYVEYVYKTIGYVIIGVATIIVTTFLLFCIGWTFWISDPKAIILLILIITLEIIVFEISIRTRVINQQNEEWDESTAHKMLCYGLLYPFIMILEVAMVVGLAYFIIAGSAKWFQIVTSTVLISLLYLQYMNHLCVHCERIYGL